MKNCIQKSGDKIKFTDFVRFSREDCIDDVKFSELLKYLKKYPDSINELTFFDGYFHSVPKICVFEEFAEKFADRMSVLHNLGIRVGINHFVTLGFFEQGGSMIFRDSQFIVHPNGKISVGKLCTTSKKTYEYIKKSYSIIALLHPDFIYTDDDISVEYDQICCCNACIKKFEKATGLFSENNMKVSRRGLNELLKSNDNKRKLIDFHISNITKIYELIEKTVHGIDSDIELGFMQCNFMMKDEIASYAGADSAGKSIRMRPGGGLYNDRDVVGILEKANRIGDQITNVPSCITKIEAELENFPNQPQAKSERYYTFECFNYLAHGCTGVAHSIFNPEYGFSEYESRFSMLKNIRVFASDMIKIIGKTPMCGASYLTGFSDENTYYKKVKTPALCLPEISLAGIPFTNNTEKSDVYVLNKKNVEFLSDREIKRAFEKSVFMTGEALEMLNERGFRDYTGFDIEESYKNNTKERELSSRFNLNDGKRRTVRDGAQAFWWLPEYGKSYTVKPINGKTENIAEIIDFDGKTKGISLAAGYNKFGKKVAVSCYYAEHFAGCMSRQHQLREIFKWLSDGAIKATVESSGKIMLVCRETDDGDTLILLNYSQDDIENVKLSLKAPQTAPLRYVYYDNGKTVKTQSEITDDSDGKVIIIPRIPCYSCGYLVLR